MARPTDDEILKFSNGVAGGTGAAAGGAAGAPSAGGTGAAGGAFMSQPDGGAMGGGQDQLGGVASGAVAGGSVGGPWGAIIGAAAGLLTQVMKQKQDSAAQKLKYKIDQQEAAQTRLATAQNRQVSTVGEMANRSSNAYQQLLGVLARSVR